MKIQGTDCNFYSRRGVGVIPKDFWFSGIWTSFHLKKNKKSKDKNKKEKEKKNWNRKGRWNLGSISSRLVFSIAIMGLILPSLLESPLSSWFSVMDRYGGKWSYDSLDPHVPVSASINTPTPHPPFYLVGEKKKG